MTPFGLGLRQLRRQHGVRQMDMAENLGLSAAYLSALEHGNRGQPSRGLVDQICAYFNLIWDEAEALHRLAQLSDPKVVVDTRDLSARATELANLLAETIGALDEETIEWIIGEIQGASGQRGGPTH